MPRIAGVNLLGVLLAGIAIYAIGALWYGLLFGEPYMNGIGVFFAEDGQSYNWLAADGVRTTTMDDAEPLWMLGGIVMPLVLAFGFGWLMKKLSIASLAPAAVFGFWLGMLIGVPLMAYGLVYSPWHDWTAFLVGASHTIVTFVVGCIVLSFFD